LRRTARDATGGGAGVLYNGTLRQERAMSTNPQPSVVSVIANARIPTKLAARLEPFDSYWQAPADVERGYKSFSAYYRANYLPHIPADRNARILVISCGPGYLVDLLAASGYRNVLGIDSDAGKVEFALRRGLNCQVAEVFAFLALHQSGEYDCIIPEQELNHLTIDETIAFLDLCRRALRPGGQIIVYAMNGANPLVGSENLAHNIDHFYNVTEYSIAQLLQLAGFQRVRPFALKLYVFWKNPANYVGLLLTSVMETAMRAIFTLYGKKVRILSKKIAAIAERPPT
jgi:2-polyprenyl-3-methyl-5-hydroxy-6-metoxy-1,4-benzoquinol methylase